MKREKEILRKPRRKTKRRRKKSHAPPTSERSFPSRRASASSGRKLPRTLLTRKRRPRRGRRKLPRRRVRRLKIRRVLLAEVESSTKVVESSMEKIDEAPAPPTEAPPGKNAVFLWLEIGELFLRDLIIGYMTKCTSLS